MHGNVHVLSTLRKLLVYLSDVLCDYWKLFMAYATESKGRTLFAQVDAYNQAILAVSRDVVRYHFPILQSRTRRQLSRPVVNSQCTVAPPFPTLRVGQTAGLYSMYTVHCLVTIMAQAVHPRIRSEDLTICAF